MNLDQVLTQMGLKLKQLVVLDTSFPNPRLKEFASAYPHRYVHLSSHEALVMKMAAGLASLGKWVVILGEDLKEETLPDPTLNVKLLKVSKDAVWDYFEDGLRRFGPGVLLIPEDE